MYTNCFIQISLFLSNQLLLPPAKKSTTLIDNLPPSLLQHNSCMTPTNFHTKDHNTTSSLFTLHTSFIFPSIPHPPKFDFMHMYVCKMFYNMSLSFHTRGHKSVWLPPFTFHTKENNSLWHPLFQLPIPHSPPEFPIPSSPKSPPLPPYLSLHHPPPPLPVPSSFTCS